MSDPKCRCSNHMGGMKNQYPNRDKALQQAIWHAKRGRGGTFTIVVCKTDPQIFHVVSSREAKKQ